MKNAQEEGLKTQTSEITASTVVIDKPQENPPQPQIQQIKEDSIKPHKSFELCHPALSTIKAICPSDFISFDNSDRNIFIASVLA